jgi:hypothetical protein
MTPEKPFLFMPAISTRRRLFGSMLVTLMFSVIRLVCGAFVAFILIASPAF